MFSTKVKRSEELNFEIKLNDQIYEKLVTNKRINTKSKSHVHFLKDEQQNFIYHISNHHEYLTKRPEVNRIQNKHNRNFNKQSDLVLIDSLNRFMLYIFILFIIIVNILCLYILPFFFKQPLLIYND